MTTHRPSKNNFETTLGAVTIAYFILIVLGVAFLTHFLVRSETAWERKTGTPQNVVTPFNFDGLNNLGPRGKAAIQAAGAR